MANKTMKEMLMAAVMAATERLKGYSKTKTEAKTNSAGWLQANNMNTRNSYGEFTWVVCRRKGYPVAVINRKGKLYCRLQMMPGFGYRAMQQDIVDWLNDRLCCEASK
ncbi:MAG: hypothetical protein Q4A62_10845 [Eikenella sp.]|nr:hypothetical protein [Eikenella sp.]